VTTALFTAAGNVPGLDVGLDFNRAAFALETNDPERAVSDAIVGSNAVYVITLDRRQESYTPEFKDVAGDIMPIVTSNAQHEAFLKRTGSLRETLVDGMTAGKSFMDAAIGTGLNVVTTAPFTVYDSMVSNSFEHADLLVPKLVSLEKGDVSEPAEVPDGALLAAVVDRQPGDFAAVQMLTPELLRTVASYRSGLVFEDWSDYLLGEGKMTDYRTAKPGSSSSEAEQEEPPAPSEAQQRAGDLL